MILEHPHREQVATGDAYHSSSVKLDIIGSLCMPLPREYLYGKACACRIRRETPSLPGERSCCTAQEIDAGSNVHGFQGHIHPISKIAVSCARSSLVIQLSMEHSESLGMLLSLSPRDTDESRPSHLLEKITHCNL